MYKYIYMNKLFMKSLFYYKNYIYNNKYMIITEKRVYDE